MKGNFHQFSLKTCIVGTHLKCLTEALPIFSMVLFDDNPIADRLNQ